VPGITFDEAKKSGRRAAELAAGAAPMPREMAFPLASAESWSNLYDYIRYLNGIYDCPFTRLNI
jgi:hypothetical protein